jgi:predicted nuclease with TOPRIM domain
LRLYVGSVEIVDEEDSLLPEEEKVLEDTDDEPNQSPSYSPPASSQEEDIDFIYRVEDQIVQLTNKFSSLFHEKELRKTFYYVKDSLKETFSVLKSSVEGYYIVERKAPPQEQSTEFAKQESNLLSSVKSELNVTESVNISPVEEKSDESMPEPPTYLSLPVEADIQMAEIVLPPNMVNDLQRLEGMGFLDRSKNFLLLSARR